MKVKKGVSLRGVKWQMFLACILAEGVFVRRNYELVITSGSEGKHVHDTHADGYAVDWRSRDIPKAEWSDIAVAVRTILPPGYDVVVESVQFH